MAPAGVAAVAAGPARVFLLVEPDEGGEAATLSAANGDAAWTGAATAPVGEADPGAWLDAATAAWLGKAPGGEVDAVVARDGRLELDASWPLARGGGGLRGVARVSLAPAAEPGHTRAAILGIAVDAAAAAVAAAASLADSNAALAAAAADAGARAEATARERAVAEEALLAKFVLVLNSKKAECARLKARLDGARPGGTAAASPAPVANAQAQVPVPVPVPAPAPAPAPPAAGEGDADVEAPLSGTDSGTDALDNASERREESASMVADTE